LQCQKKGSVGWLLAIFAGAIPTCTVAIQSWYDTTQTRPSVGSAKLFIAMVCCDWTAFPFNARHTYNWYDLKFQTQVNRSSIYT
jgi:hypothetical protein